MPAQQRLVEQRWVSVDERVEVSYRWVGRDVVGNYSGPGDGDRLVVLLGCAMASCDLLDPVTHPVGRVVTPSGRDEGEIDVLPVAEPVIPADLGHDPGQFAA